MPGRWPCRPGGGRSTPPPGPLAALRRTRARFTLEFSLAIFGITRVDTLSPEPLRTPAPSANRCQARRSRRPPTYALSDAAAGQWPRHAAQPPLCPKPLEVLSLAGVEPVAVCLVAALSRHPTCSTQEGLRSVRAFETEGLGVAEALAVLAEAVDLAAGKLKPVLIRHLFPLSEFQVVPETGIGEVQASNA